MGREKKEVRVGHGWEGKDRVGQGWDGKGEIE